MASWLSAAPFALVTLRSCSLFAVMRSCPSRVDTSVLHGFTSVLLLSLPSSVKWAQPWVLLGGCLGTALHRGSEELVIVKAKGTQACVLKCSVLKMSAFRMLSFTKLCGSNRDEHTHAVLHMFIPWKLPVSSTKQESEQSSDIF